MAAGAWKKHQKFTLRSLNVTNLLGDLTNYKVALFLSTSNINTLSVGTGVYGDWTNEVATAFGYTAGGWAVTNPTLTEASGVVTLDFDDPTWAASGGSIVARFAGLYKNATVNSIVKPVVAVCLLDTTPANVTATTGNNFTIQMSATGGIVWDGASTD